MFEKAGAMTLALLMLSPLVVENGGGAFDEGMDIGTALGTMFLYVERQMDGPGVERPIDSSSILTRVLRGEIEPIASTRVDDPPSTWDLVRTGTYCEIYLAQGETMSTSRLDALEAVFDIRIYPNATGWFHPSTPPSQVEIRIYDMGDGPGGVGGFFIASPMHRDDLYLDIQDISVIDEILAHEFEHMLHYDLDPNEAVWLDEGMADLSVRISLGPDTPAIHSHISLYEQRPENDLIAWDDGTPEDNIADYGAAYSYVAYLADHFGGATIMASLTSEPLNSMAGVDQVLSDLGYGEDGLDVHRGVKVANLLDDPVFGGGIYDQGLIDIGISTFQGRTDSYPYQDEVTSTVSYAGYYYEFTGGGSGLSILINSTVNVHTALIGISGGEVVFSDNITSDTGSSASLDLPDFGVTHDLLYAIPSTDIAGGGFDLSVMKTSGTPPVTDVEIDPALPDGTNGYYLTPPTIALSGDPGVAVYFSWDDDEDQIYTGPITAPEGDHSLGFFSSDLGLEEDRREIGFSVDTLMPATDYRILPSDPDGIGGVYVTSPTVTLSSEAGAVIFYDLGEGEMIYSAPFRVPHGDHDIKYWSVDRAGNTEIQRIEEVTVDISDPSALLISDPGIPDGEKGYYKTPPTISFEHDTSHSVFFSINGSNYSVFTAPFSLDDGEYEISYFAVTTSGREGPKRDSPFKVDSTKPSLDVITDPVQEDGWTTDPMYLTLVTDDAQATLQLMLGDDGPYDYSDPILLTDGEYDITSWAVDLAGNRVDGSVVEVRIDSTPPDSSLIISREPENDIWYQDSSPEMEIQGRGMILSDERFYYSINEGDYLLYNWENIELELGINTIRYYGMDQAGNEESKKTKEIGLDLEPPVPIIWSNRTIVGGFGPITFYLEGCTDDVGIASYRVHFGDGTDSGWIARDRVIHNYTDLGEYNAYVEVLDHSGRTSTIVDPILIEVLTPEEASRRLAPNEEGPQYLLFAITALLLITLVCLIVILAIRYRRDRPADVEWADVEEGENRPNMRTVAAEEGRKGVIHDESEEDWEV